MDILEIPPAEHPALQEMLNNYPELSAVAPAMAQAFQLLAECYDNGGTVFTCGNGGSCADSDHITGELLKGFCKKRPMPPEERQRLLAAFPEETNLADKLQRGLPAIPLMNLTALASAVANDLGGLYGPAQALYALARPGDVLIALSTSGNAENVYHALAAAKAKGVRVIGMTGQNGGRLARLADVAIRVPATETFRVQEYHLPVYHALCRMVEDRYFRE